MTGDTPEVTARDLGEARRLLDAARAALQPVLDDGGEDVRLAVARIGRIEAEVAGIERVVAGQKVGVS